ncbi:MAG: hypothetical protein Q8P18_12980 [Pseudomonadota bacterium]|nr:hypothetical protein [Pseudomonadota bacterium]
MLSLFLLAACDADRVTVDGLEPFDVRSEVWTRESDADGAVQAIVLTNVEGYCEKARAANDAFADTVGLDVDDAAYCVDAKGVMQTWAAAMSALWFAGAHYLQLQPTGDGGPEDLAVGDWGGESTASALAGSLTYVDQDFYLTYLEDWDVDAEGIERCGVKSRNEMGELPVRDLETGLMTIESVEAGAVVTGELEATFEALEGEDAAIGVTAGFDAEWCDLAG